MKTEFDAEELNLITLAQEYSDEDKARSLLESLRWPQGPVCPHCKAEKPYSLKPNPHSRRPGRKGLYKCRSCRKQFTVTVGTILEDSHIPISKWLMAIFIICSSKNAVSAHQLHRMLGMTYKSAWFMAHRIRFAMVEGPLAEILKGTVEVDETFVGGKKGHDDPEPTGGYSKGTKKVPLVAAVQCDGKVKTMTMQKVTGKNLKQFVNANVHKASLINTDELLAYRNMFWDYDRHHAVNNGLKEYACHNADGSCSHINTAESFFSLRKRGIVGAYHHVSPEHLHRYATKIEFRWNNRKRTDGECLEAAIRLVEGKRLTYRQVV